jgi:methylisocitrate lyase
MAERAGAKALYVSGAGVINGLTAYPDIGLLTITEVAQQLRYISRAVTVPVIADADTGFGEGLLLWRSIEELERAGVAGVHIEDQEMPKRCGHLEGKSLIAVEDMVKKIRTAVRARSDPSFVLIARTDARAVEGFDAAMARAHAYGEAGADMIFPEALTTIDEFVRFAREVHVPLLANMTEFGKTPLLSAKEFDELGYRAVIFPMTGFRMMLKTLERCYKTLLGEGTQRSLLSDMLTRQELYEAIHYPDYEVLDRELGEGKEANHA